MLGRAGPGRFAAEILHPASDLFRVVLPRFEPPRACLSRQHCDLGGVMKQASDGGANRLTIDAIKGDASTAARRLAQGSAIRADAGLPVRKAFKHGKSE